MNFQIGDRIRFKSSMHDLTGTIVEGGGIVYDNYADGAVCHPYFKYVTLLNEGPETIEDWRL